MPGLWSQLRAPLGSCPLPTDLFCCLLGWMGVRPAHPPMWLLPRGPSLLIPFSRMRGLGPEKPGDHGESRRCPESGHGPDPGQPRLSCPSSFLPGGCCSAVWPAAGLQGNTRRAQQALSPASKPLGGSRTCGLHGREDASLSALPASFPTGGTGFSSVIYASFPTSLYLNIFLKKICIVGSITHVPFFSVPSPQEGTWKVALEVRKNREPLNPSPATNRQCDLSLRFFI